MDAPIVIVGAGIAGLATALAVAPARVLLLNRGSGQGKPASAMAQGGIAAAMGIGDEPRAHAHDTLVAGAFHNDAAVVNWLCAQAPATIGWLERQGVAFDRDADGRLQLGREGGHGVARIVHSGGDATGEMLMRALRERAKAAAHVTWRDGVDVDALLLRGEAARGVRVRDVGGTACEIPARAVVLATGGIGALFARTSNPPGADGAGLALGMAAGARARDLEFVQFHPTALDVPAAHCLPLITEALRGAGARLIDAQGRYLMDGVDARGDLAPRDIVSRAVWRAQHEGRQALLDAREVAGDWSRRFPTVLAACLAHGVDPRREPIPVTPAAHFHMGGLAVDLNGNTSVPGLHAVGEVACNGVHGANRLASNSLLEGVACGRRLGAALAMREAPAARGAARWVERGPTLSGAALERLHQRLWDAAGPVRDGARLHAAWLACRDELGDAWQSRLAMVLLAAARDRPASLGAHWRQDAAALAVPGRIARGA
ncbi:MAG: FAD-dependent oxidoreductase [Proteobacteria bacterium]|nr:FAD-dependent oxidoreductase [Pseudomonadota bacterium]